MTFRFKLALALLAISNLPEKDVEAQQIVSICGSDFNEINKSFNMGDRILSSGQSIKIVAPQWPRGETEGWYKCRIRVKHASGGKLKGRLVTRLGSDCSSRSTVLSLFGIVDNGRPRTRLNCGRKTIDVVSKGNFITIALSVTEKGQEDQDFTIKLKAM